MYPEDQASDMPVREPEAFKALGEIKNELFRIREKLAPVLIDRIEKSHSNESLPGGATPLAHELSTVLEIVRSLKQDISL